MSGRKLLDPTTYLHHSYTLQHTAKHRMTIKLFVSVQITVPLQVVPGLLRVPSDSSVRSSYIRSHIAVQFAGTLIVMCVLWRQWTLLHVTPRTPLSLQFSIYWKIFSWGKVADKWNWPFNFHPVPTLRMSGTNLPSFDRCPAGVVVTVQLHVLHVRWNTVSIHRPILACGLPQKAPPCFYIPSCPSSYS